ncbi:uncharacterized protein EI90DRAFT_1296678 [Cantharellus anzutake]|uniref:uncharacterized protein n=1 Tax=Cantharellus anzutake TaxID=1750568 RepID=UPI0019085CC2|nr:uncharacterized protein EI90DRAFT_1296678 [Cantharellus anzutake]KAF8342019.1 hypothetical protein EI90DRAFT_1296678 [Cantharellus anzutake]
MGSFRAGRTTCKGILESVRAAGVVLLLQGRVRVSGALESRLLRIVVRSVRRELEQIRRLPGALQRMAIGDTTRRGDVTFGKWETPQEEPSETATKARWNRRRHPEHSHPGKGGNLTGTAIYQKWEFHAQPQLSRHSHLPLFWGKTRFKQSTLCPSTSSGSFFFF